MDRSEWLKSLKPDDIVANKRHTYDCEVFYETFIVMKITPKGQIRLTNNILLDSDGYYEKRLGFSDRIRIHIEPYTDEIIAFNERRKRDKELERELYKVLDIVHKKASSIPNKEEVLEYLKGVIKSEKRNN